MSETGSSASGEPTPAALRPAEVAERLGISAATLRRWSSRFGEFLELGEGGQDGGTHRRYSAGDVATLAHVQELLEQGWTYEQVADRLSQGPADVATSEPLGESVAAAASPDAEPGLPSETAMVSTGALFDDNAGLSEDALPPAARFLRDTMQAVTGNQQIILNSQQASRDMLGVMIQDNLNLKSENTSLRERMLELERELAELHRHFVEHAGTHRDPDACPGRCDCEAHGGPATGVAIRPATRATARNTTHASAAAGLCDTSSPAGLPAAGLCAAGYATPVLPAARLHVSNHGALTLPAAALCGPAAAQAGFLVEAVGRVAVAGGRL